MIQRIQSVYLALAAILSGAAAFFIPFFRDGDNLIYLLQMPYFMAAFILSALIDFYSIFRYKNRKQQILSGRLNIILNFCIFGFLLVKYYKDFAFGSQNFGYGLILPLLAVILISMANRGIMRDELLVRSMDRLR